MKVSELIEYLEEFDPDMEVKFSYNYGDYWNTEVAESVERVREEKTTYSDYHRKDKILDEDDSRYEDDNSITSVILSN